MTTANPPVNSTSALAIFRNRNFSLLWTSQLVSEMGSSITSLASSIFVYQTTGSALDVGLMMMAAAAPSLLVGLFAGVFVDRYDRKWIMVSADFIRAGLVFAIPFLMPLNIAWLYILVALSSTVGQFFSPAHASLMPDIASEDELNAANSMMAVSSYGSMAVGYATSGLIASRFPIEWAFYIDAFSFVVSGILTLLVKAPAMQVEGKTGVAAVFTNLRAGWDTIRQTPIVRSLFLVFLPIFITFGFMNALRLPFTIQALQASEFEFGLLEGLTLAGFVIASLIMANLGDRLREGQWLAISFFGMSFTGIVFSLISSIPLAFLIIVIEGFMNAPSVIARSLVIQRNTPREMRGRTFSGFFVMRDVMFMVGMLAAGLADLLPIRLLYLSGGLVTLAVSVVTLVMPGLGQPAAEWRRAISLLRSVPQAPRLELGSILLASDYNRLARLVPALAELDEEKQASLRSEMTLIEAPAGAAVLRLHETSDAAYFILEGQAIAGIEKDGVYHILETLQAGDFFGEIAALTGVPRTADVITQQPSTLVKVPSPTLHLMADDPQLNQLFTTRMAERLARTRAFDSTRSTGLDQELLRELRTASE